MEIKKSYKILLALLMPIFLIFFINFFMTKGNIFVMNFIGAVLSFIAILWVYVQLDKIETEEEINKKNKNGMD